MNDRELYLSPPALTVAEVAARCREETAAKTKPRPRPSCLELFRRAIVENDVDARAALYVQYRDLLRYWAWLPPHSDDLAHEAFIRFTRAAPARFAAGGFPNIDQILAYLRTIAKNARNSLLRQQARETEANSRWVAEQQAKGTISDWGGVDRQQLMECVIRELKNERERLLVAKQFGLGIKPEEIALRHPEYFPRVEDVYQTRDTLLRRLQRAPGLQRFL